MPLVRREPPKKRRQKPDEIAQYGPIVLERYGRFTRVRNLADAEYFRQIKAKAPEFVKNLEKEIREAIAELRVILASLDPFPCLQNADGEFFVAHLGIEDEPSLTQDHVHEGGIRSQASRGGGREMTSADAGKTYIDYIPISCYTSPVP